MLVLARFVLTHSLIACPEVRADPFLHLIDAAMGMSFAVVLANVYLVFVERKKRYIVSVSIHIPDLSKRR